VGLLWKQLNPKQNRAKPKPSKGTANLPHSPKVPTVIFVQKNKEKITVPIPPRKHKNPSHYFPIALNKRERYVIKRVLY
jgi:hypothetical protein